ncbi:MAG: hypothetical protein RR049_07465, partial [Angelakisella sp.]
ISAGLRVSLATEEGEEEVPEELSEPLGEPLSEPLSELGASELGEDGMSLLFSIIELLVGSLEGLSPQAAMESTITAAIARDSARRRVFTENLFIRCTPIN